MNRAKRKIDARSTLGSGKLEHRTSSDEIRKRNAFAACGAFRIEGLDASLNHAREIAVREELDAVEQAIASSNKSLVQINKSPEGVRATKAISVRR
jgi:hypothetical protein